MWIILIFRWESFQDSNWESSQGFQRESIQDSVGNPFRTSMKMLSGFLREFLQDSDEIALKILMGVRSRFLRESFQNSVVISLRIFTIILSLFWRISFGIPKRILSENWRESIQSLDESPVRIGIRNPKGQRNISILPGTLLVASEYRTPETLEQPQKKGFWDHMKILRMLLKFLDTELLELLWNAFLTPEPSQNSHEILLRPF